MKTKFTISQDTLDALTEDCSGIDGAGDLFEEIARSIAKRGGEDLEDISDVTYEKAHDIVERYVDALRLCTETFFDGHIEKDEE